MKNNTEEVQNSNRIKTIYMGVVLNSGKKLFRYYFPDTKDVMSFNRKLLSFEMVGSILEVERTNTGVKGPYKPIKPYNVQPDDKELYEKVLQWSIEDRCAKEEFAAISSLKVGSDNTIDNIIEKLLNVL